LEPDPKIGERIALASEAAATAFNTLTAETARLGPPVFMELDLAESVQEVAFLAAAATHNAGSSPAAAALRVAMATVHSHFANAVTAMASAIRWDFELLRSAAALEGWTDETPVSQDFFGPLWPEGQPSGWPRLGEPSGDAKLAPNGFWGLVCKQ
jgi:hypothetical protein